MRHRLRFDNKDDVVKFALWATLVNLGIYEEWNIEYLYNQINVLGRFEPTEFEPVVVEVYCAGSKR